MVNRSSRKNSRNAAAVALGRLGGLKGGKARAAKLSAEERREIARKGAVRRWSKEREKPHSAPNDFEIQKKKFQRIPADVLAHYENHYVVSRNGQIVDSDLDLPTLTRRFFKNHARKSVYIAKVGGGALIIGSPVLEQ